MTFFVFNLFIFAALIKLDKVKFVIGLTSLSRAYNEAEQVIENKVNLARGKISFGIAVEFKISTGYTSEKY